MLMENKTIGWKWIVLTLVIGVIAFLTGPTAPLGHFWGHTENAMPTGVQMLLLIILSVIQSLAFGFGVAFLIFGWGFVKNILPAHPRLGFATYLAIAWSLISWWPHSNFHQTLKAGNINGLLAIEYGFHVTLIIGGLILANFIFSIVKQK